MGQNREASPPATRTRSEHRGHRLNRSWHEALDGRRIPLAGLLAALVTASVNTGLREVGERWLDVPPDQAVLSLTVVLTATVGSVFLASLALALLGGTQARPFTIFRRLAAVAFLLASAAAVLAYLGWLPGVPTLTYATMLVLVGMNAVTAVSCIAFLTTMPRGGTSGAGWS